MPEFTCKIWQTANFGQLCFGGKIFRVQALDVRRESGSGANRPNCDLALD